MWSFFDYIQFDAPEVVIEAIAWVVDQVNE